MRNALAAEAPSTYVRAMIEDPVGVTPALWETMAELGWLGVLVPESAGGLGLGLVDVVVLQEEMGKLPFPGPVGVLGGGRHPGGASGSASTTCSRIWPRDVGGARWRWRSPATGTRWAR